MANRIINVEIFTQNPENFGVGTPPNENLIHLTPWRLELDAGDDIYLVVKTGNINVTNEVGFDFSYYLQFHAPFSMDNPPNPLDAIPPGARRGSLNQLIHLGQMENRYRGQDLDYSLYIWLGDNGDANLFVEDPKMRINN